MKFVKRIGDGEVTINDNEVVEKAKSDTERADDWAEEFSVDSNQVFPLPFMNISFTISCILYILWHICPRDKASAILLEVDDR